MGKGIAIYCKCEGCGVYFEVTGSKRSVYCCKKCRNRSYMRSVRGSKVANVGLLTAADTTKQ